MCRTSLSAWPSSGPTRTSATAAPGACPAWFTWTWATPGRSPRPIRGSPTSRSTITGTDAFGNPFAANALTNATGNYTFANLAPGTYTVTETQPAAYAQGTNTVGTVNGNASGTNGPGTDVLGNVAVGAGQGGVGYNFGELGGGLAGLVWLDRNGNGTQEVGEPGIGNVSVTLTGTDVNGAPVTRTTATLANGTYAFADLPAGNYTVTETQPNGYGNSPGTPAVVRSNITLPPGGAVPSQNFGEQLGTLAGLVYVDTNRNGTVDPGEPGIGNVTVHLTGTDVNGLAANLTVQTLPDGTYSFGDLLAGNYAVAETQPAGFAQGNNAVGPAGGVVGPGTDQLTAIPMAPGAVEPGYNFGEIASTITGRVYYDANQDGVFDAGDSGIANVTVTLRDGNGTVVGTQTTGPTGGYTFVNLPAGTYTITETQPPGYGSSETSSNTQTVTLASGGAVTAQDFGDTLGNVSGSVYADFNLDGVFDTTTVQHPDTGIGGITVTLLAGNGTVLATTTTAANGGYLFPNLPTGNYTVVETQPPLPTAATPGYYDGADNLGSVGGARTAKNAMSLTLGTDSTTHLSQNGTAYNFGEVPPADPFGFVYQDVNHNGVKDAGEPGIAGVSITLAGNVTQVLANGTVTSRPLTAADAPNGLTVTTNSLGRYDFNPVPPGLYSIAEAQPAGYLDGQEQDGDPNGPPATVGNDVFTNVLLNPFPVRGPFNFGELLVPPPSGPLPPLTFQTGDLSKRSFLGSTAPAALDLPTDPNYAAVRGPSPTAPVYVAVSGDNGWVRVFDYGTGVERFRLQPFGDFTGGVRVAVADVTGDGIPDIITAAGPGGGPRVVVFDGSTGAAVSSFYAFESTYTGGVYVAAGDMNGDGRAEIVATPDIAGGPRVVVFQADPAPPVSAAVPVGGSPASASPNLTFHSIASFYALDPVFRGGLRVAAGDVNGDGAADVVVVAGPGGGPEVAGFSGKSIVAGSPTRLFSDFYAFDPNLRIGYFVTVADTNADGFGDVVVSAGFGGGPRVSVFDGKQLVTANQPVVTANFYAGYDASGSGAEVKVLSLNGTPVVLSVPGLGSRPYVYTYNLLTFQRIDVFYAFGPGLLNGEYIG